MTDLDRVVVSVIIPIFNRYEYTRRCLESLKRLPQDGIEAIVVDNASSDGSGERISQSFPWVQVVRSEENRGYAGGCNLGMRHARGAYFLLLNNDTEVLDPTFFDALTRVLDSNPRVGAVGPKTVDYVRHDEVWFDGGTDALGFPKISGAAYLLRRKALEQVGMLDEGLFAYFEDSDLFARLGEAGWSIQHEQSVRVAHLGSLTSGLGSPFYYYYMTRNLVIFLRRHCSPATLLVRALPRWIPGAAWFLKKSFAARDWPALRSWIRGHWDGAMAALTDQPKHGPPLAVASAAG